ncbi:MAG: PEP-CTERM sorting domain-containing protein [Myxococcota bacterium]
MRAFSCSHVAVSAFAAAFSFVAFATPAAAAFTINLSSADFDHAHPIFSDVTNFSISIEMDGDLETGQSYDNASVLSVQYSVNGTLEPGTPSGFSAFALNRTPGGEGVISGDEWRSQGSSVLFETAETANLLDGLQVGDLVPGFANSVLRIDAREFEREDVSRYHPPFLVLRANGSLLLKSSNNSSGDSGSINPQTGESVDLQYGEEYITRFENRSKAEPITIAPPIPEPGTALLMGLGLAGLASVGRRR